MREDKRLNNILDMVQRLQNEFGDAVEVVAATSSDAVDEALPQVVAAPRDAESAQALMAWSGREQLALIARGGGTRLEIGACPTRFDLSISTHHLNQIVEHDVGNATVSAQSGISLRALDKIVRAQGQFVPLQIGSAFDSAHESASSAHESASENDAPESTLGGAVATNAAGASRMKFGAPRDLVVGLDAALSDGRLVRSGSKVVKNVSGYDLNKIFTGSCGSLGLLTQITLRLRPLDESSQLWSRAFDSWPALVSQAFAIFDGAFEPTILRAQISSNGFDLFARFDGVGASVQSQIGRLPQNDSAPHEYSCEGAVQEASVRLRAVLPLRRAASWAQAARETGATIVVWNCGTGIARAAFAEVPDVARLRALAESDGGALVVERAPAELKTPDFVWGAPRAEFGLMRRLKEKFDAASVCAPGRFVGGL